ncbi:MAG TPA: hypothetical protein VEG30_12930 [Terriglobales bacterium]|nr:hypothetical protein [Terriglobales bacterium]
MDVMALGAPQSKEAELSEQPGPQIQSSSRTKLAWVFWTLLFVYSLTWAGHYTSGDGAQKVQWARQILAGGPYLTDVVTGHPPKYGVGHTILALPPLLLSKILLAARGLHSEAALYTFLFVVNGAFLLYLIARYLSLQYSPRQTWAAVLIVGLATSWWPYTKLDFTEVFVLTFFFAGFLLLKSEYNILGFSCAGFAILLRTDSIVLFALLLIWQIRRQRPKRAVLEALAGVLPIAIVYVTVNLLRYGSILDHGYPGESFSNPLLIGLYGILFSSGKSVFLFSPALLLGFLGWKKFRRILPLDADLFLEVFLCELLIYSKWWDWSGDDSWGVRYMIPGVILMTIPCVEMLERRVLTASVVLIGLCIQIPAVLVSGLEYVVAVHDFTLKRKAMYVEGWNRIDVDDVRFNPRYSQIVGNYELLRLKVGKARISGFSETEEQTGTPLEQSLREKKIPQTGTCSLDLIWCGIHRQKGSNQQSVPGN